MFYTVTLAPLLAREVVLSNANTKHKYLGTQETVGSSLGASASLILSSHALLAVGVPNVS